MTSVVHGALWVSDLTRLPRAEARPDCVILEVLDHRDIIQLAQAMDVAAGVVAARRERGSRAFAAWTSGSAAWDADGIAAWLWVSIGSEWAWPIRRELQFQPDECYGWDADVRPGRRGSALFSALLLHAGERMAREGRRWMWGGILDDNLASQRSCTAAGWRPVLRLAAVHAPEPRLWTRAADYADARLVERARLILGEAVEVAS